MNDSFLNSILYELENDRINFEDKLSLAFMVIGGIFFTIIIVSALLNALSFDSVEFDTPFF